VEDSGQEGHREVCCQPEAGRYRTQWRRARLLRDGPSKWMVAEFDMWLLADFFFTTFLS